MAFPSTRKELETSGYRISNYGRCRGCQEPIEWWHTPSGERMPLNTMPTPESASTAHFSTCPQADQFRKPPQRSEQCELFNKS